MLLYSGFWRFPLTLNYSLWASPFIDKPWLGSCPVQFMITSKLLLVPLISTSESNSILSSQFCLFTSTTALWGIWSILNSFNCFLTSFLQVSGSPFGLDNRFLPTTDIFKSGYLSLISPANSSPTDPAPNIATFCDFSSLLLMLSRLSLISEVLLDLNWFKVDPVATIN